MLLGCIWSAITFILVIIGYRIGAYKGGEFVRDKLAKKEQQALPSAVNILGGIVFPDADDYSWVLKRICPPSREKDFEGYLGYVMGAVKLWFVDTGRAQLAIGEDTDSVWTYYCFNEGDRLLVNKYFCAVDRAYMQRKALEAIVST